MGELSHKYLRYQTMSREDAKSSWIYAKTCVVKYVKYVYFPQYVHSRQESKSK